MRSCFQAAVCLAVGCLAGCYVADEPSLVVEIPQSQPASPDLGTIVRIHAHGGHALSISIEAGQMRLANNTAAIREACVPLRQGAASPISLAVRPDNVESLLSVALYEYPADTGMDCSGHILDSIQVAIKAPAGNPSIDAGGSNTGGPDAGIVDANSPDAPVSPDANSADAMPTNDATSQGGM